MWPALRFLALDLLPWWENHVHYQHSQQERKKWSHLGEYVLDEMNVLYRLVVDICLRMRRDLGLPPLSMISQLNEESKGDVLEGILGLAFSYHPLLPPPHLDAIKRNVVAATLAVKEIWNSATYHGEYNIEVLVNRILYTDVDTSVCVTPSHHEIQLHQRQMAQG